MTEIIQSQCSCGESISIEVGTTADLCARADRKRPFYPDENLQPFTVGGIEYRQNGVTTFRCRKCGGWIADTVPGAEFGGGFMSNQTNNKLSSEFIDNLAERVDHADCYGGKTWFDCHEGAVIVEALRELQEYRKASKEAGKLRRFDIDMSDCDSCGQDCGADMVEDIDGEYVLMEEVIPYLYRHAEYATPPLQAVTVPDGWQLVPKEATKEMLDAAWISHGINHPSAYRTMLAAAPQPSSNPIQLNNIRIDKL